MLASALRLPSLLAGLALAGPLLVVPVAQAQLVLVDPGAREIRGYRLTADRLARLDQITRAMDRHVPTHPEASRADVAMVVVLTMAFAYGEPWKDTTVDETVRTLEGGHAELVAEIRRAGLSTRDYVLTQMTLILAHTIVAEKRSGGSRVSPAAISPDTLAWAEANWPEVDRVMTAIGQRVASERARSERVR